MAGLSMLGGELLSERMRELKEELARLRAYQVLAEYNLKQMGVSLEDAERQGWVSKRAEVRRKRQERKKAAENAKWAKVKRDREWIRKQRKEVGLPVEDPTPTPSETAYKQRVEEAAREETEERLRNRVRRVSHQLLIAAAIGKQYRELTVADHSGSVVPGGDQAVRLQYSPLDARSETSLTTTAAMARSFRNWVNRERAKHVRYRSDTPEPVVQENRAPVPEMLGGSGGDDSPADDGASGIAGPTALRAIIHDAALTDEDGSDLDEDDDFGGLTGLDATEVSDEVMATAYSMLTTAESIDHGRGHWADILADDVLQFLMYDQPATSPSAAEFSVFPTSGSGSDAGHSDAQSDLSDEVNAAAVRPLQKEANQKRNIWGGIEPDDILDPRGGAEEVHYQEQSHGQTRTNYPPEVEAALIFLKQQRTPERSPAPDSRRPKDGNLKQQQAPYRSPILVPPSPKDGNPGDNKAPSHKASSYRKPNKPATPHRSVWDPTFWRINTKDPDDGVWAGKPAAHRQPKDETETGFITWAEQEEKFPRLDARLGLSRVRGSRSMFFDTSTFDTQIWDPLSRSVMEPRTGTRVPLHLNPVTIHSLALWTMDRYGSEFSLDPIQLPDNPPNEEKKRHMQPTTTLSQPPQGVAKSTGRGLRKVSFAEEAKTFAEEDAKMQMSTKGEPGESTDEPPPEIVASIHYPLRSPAATSISRPQTQTREGQHDNAGPRTPNTRFATSFANIRPSLPGPPTPYPRAMPDTPSVPTVSLYEGGAASWNGDAAMPIVVEEEEEAEEGKGGEEEKADEEGEAAKEDEDKRLVAYLQKLHTAPGGPNKIKHGLTELELDSLASPSTRPVALMQRPHTAGGGGDVASLNQNKREFTELEMDLLASPKRPVALMQRLYTAGGVRPAALVQRPHTAGGDDSSTRIKRGLTGLELDLLASPKKKKRRASAGDPADAESAAVEREPAPHHHHIHASNEAPPYDQREEEAAGNEKVADAAAAAAAAAAEEEGHTSPDEQQLYTSTSERRPSDPPQDNVALPIPEPGSSNAQEAQASSHGSGDDALVADPPQSQESRGPGDGDGAQLKTSVETADIATTRGSGGGEKKSVRFRLEGSPSPGMRYGARRALQRYGRTSLRIGNYLGTTGA